MSEAGAPRDSGAHEVAPESSSQGEEPAAADTLPETTSLERPLTLTVLLLAVAAFNVYTARRGMALRAELLAAYPRLNPALFGVWLLAPAVTIAGCAGLWFMRRWGLWLVTAAWAMAMAVDLWAGITFHALIATAAMWLVVIAVRPVRHGLR
jgi:hypothetical protein